MTFDARRQRVGLCRGPAPGLYRDPWTNDGEWWLQLAPAHAPSARASAAFAFGPTRARAVLFGGFDGAAQLADTWEWDGIDWIARSPATSPPARRDAVLVFDP